MREEHVLRVGAVTKRKVEARLERTSWKRDLDLAWLANFSGLGILVGRASAACLGYLLQTNNTRQKVSTNIMVC